MKGLNVLLTVRQVACYCRHLGKPKVGFGDGVVGWGVVRAHGEGDVGVHDDNPRRGLGTLAAPVGLLHDRQWEPRRRTGRRLYRIIQRIEYFLKYW